MKILLKLGLPLAVLIVLAGCQLLQKPVVTASAGAADDAASPESGLEAGEAGWDYCVAPEGSALKAGGDPRRFWKRKHQFRVRFLDGNPDLQEDVMKLAGEWSRHADVTFVTVTSEPSDFRISFAGKGHWSYIGRDCSYIAAGQPTMNLSISKRSPAGDKQRVVLHEFGHALGLMHEHQHPSRTIVWNEPVVIAAYAGPPNRWDEEKTRQNVINKYTGPWGGTAQPDLESIMQYPVKKEWTLNGVSVGWNQRLSTSDMSVIKSIYGPPRG